MKILAPISLSIIEAIILHVVEVVPILPIASVLVESPMSLIIVVIILLLPIPLSCDVLMIPSSLLNETPIVMFAIASVLSLLLVLPIVDAVSLHECLLELVAALYLRRWRLGAAPRSRVRVRCQVHEAEGEVLDEESMAWWDVSQHLDSQTLHLLA